MGHKSVDGDSESSPLLANSQQTSASLSSARSSFQPPLFSRHNSGTTTPQLPSSGVLKPKTKFFLAYYFPALSWITSYKREYLFGDICSGLTVASFQIPVVMGYATSLAMVPTISGLYGLVIPPIIYSLFGCVPQMVVGPEAAISLIVGQAVTPYLPHGKRGHLRTNLSPAEVTGMISAGAGSVMLGAGILRFGFLDSVLSHALLRGFICAVGFVMIIDQLPAELGLLKLMHDTVGSHVSTYGKVGFLIKNAWQSNTLSAKFAFSAFAAMAAMRIVKGRLASRYRFLQFVPEILIVVVLSTFVCDYWDFDQLGLDVVGDIRPGKLVVEFPITPAKFVDFKTNFSAAFFAAVLGFFESTVAAKSFETLYDINVSSNRELVALGLANLGGSFVSALPSFGGYGRSKINASSGAKTPMSGLVLAAVVIFGINYLMPLFYYLPRCVLSAVISLIGFSLLEGMWADIHFYWVIHGYEELITLLITFSTTILWSVQTGIAAGVGFSLVRVIRHSTYPRIQILGRIPGTNIFKNADEHPNALESVDGCLIVKVPEPLTFANTGSLRSRLKRLEKYGSMRVHPSYPRIMNESLLHYLIVDLRGMTECDGGAIKILSELVEDYVRRGITVFFVRMPNDKTIRMRFKKSGIDDLVLNQGKRQAFFDSIDAALLSIDDDEQLQRQLQRN